jgi:hypothetical protein
MHLYIGPDRQLAGPTPPTPQELVDRLMKATLTFYHTHDREDLLRIIRITQELNSIGYLLVWHPKQGCVGCHRKDVPNAVVS